MNIKLVYHSSTGNTKKLANAIGEELNIEAEPISEQTISSSTPIDLLFIGDGIYFGKPNKKTAAMIEGLDKKKVRNVAIFATCGGQEKIGNDIKGLLQDKGINVVGDPFVCKGQAWFFANRHLPGNHEIREIKKYAKEMVAGI